MKLERGITIKIVYLLKGLPASGKSTWAKRLVKEYPGRHKRVSKDSLRSMLDSNHWSKHNEKFILNLRDHIIMAGLKDGKNVIVDDTNLEPRHEERIRKLLAGRTDVKIQIKDFTDVPVETCIKRDLVRPNSVGSKVIMQMYNKHLKLKTNPVIPDFSRDLNKEDAVIIDLDGTYALFDSRSPYDSGKCESDTVNEVVRLIADALIIQGKQKDRVPEILLVSGRSDEFREETENWIANNGIYYDALWMRKKGDVRKDSVIKAEIFDVYIRGRYNVLFVLDDRKQTTQKWRELGLQCLQVAEGDF